MLTVRSGTRRIHGNGALMIPGPGFGPGMGCGEGPGWMIPGPGFGPGIGIGSIPKIGRNGSTNTGSLYATPQASQTSAKTDTSSRAATTPSLLVGTTLALPTRRALRLRESRAASLRENVSLLATRLLLVRRLRTRLPLHKPEFPGRENHRPLDASLASLHLHADVPVLRHSLTSRSC